MLAAAESVRTKEGVVGWGLDDSTTGSLAKSVGNLMKRKDRTLKFSYGAGKCPKKAKNKKYPNLAKNREELRK